MTRKEELITRWIDGELDADQKREFDNLKDSDPGFCEQAKLAAESVGSAVRSEFDAEIEVPHGDFFNSQIEKRVREGSAPAPGQSQTIRSAISWLRSPFTWSATAAACVVLYFSGNYGAVSAGALLVSTYTPDPSVSVVSAGYNKEAHATVIMLEGLKRIPDDVDVSGKNVTFYDREGPPGFTHFYTRDAKVAYIMETDEYGSPNIF